MQIGCILFIMSVKITEKSYGRFWVKFHCRWDMEQGPSDFELPMYEKGGLPGGKLWTPMCSLVPFELPNLFGVIPHLWEGNDFAGRLRHACAQACLGAVIQ